MTDALIINTVLAVDRVMVKKVDMMGVFYFNDHVFSKFYTGTLEKALSLNLN